MDDLKNAIKYPSPCMRIEELESEGQEVLKKAAITGEGPGSIRMPSTTFNKPNESFKRPLTTLPERDSKLPAGKREDFLHTKALTDIREPIEEILAFHGLSWQRDLEPLGKQGLGSLVLGMPSRRTEVHLHRQVITNPA